jgi:hypothetical protein
MDDNPPPPKINRTTYNLWHKWQDRKDISLRDVIRMIKRYFPMFEHVADYLLRSTPAVPDMSKYYARVHAVSKMQESLACSLESTTKNVSSTTKMALSGLCIEHMSTIFIVINALGNDVHVVEVSGKRGPFEVHDDIFSSLKNTIKLTRDQCRAFQVTLATSKCVIGTPPPPLTEEQKAKLKAKRQKAAAKRKEETKEYSEGEDNVGQSSDDEEVQGGAAKKKRSKSCKQKAGEKQAATGEPAGKISKPASKAGETQAATGEQASKGGETQAATGEPASKPKAPASTKTVHADDPGTQKPTIKVEDPDDPDFEKPKPLRLSRSRHRSYFPGTEEILDDSDDEHGPAVTAVARPVVIPDNAQREIEDILRMLPVESVAIIVRNAGITPKQLQNALKRVDSARDPKEFKMQKDLGIDNMTQVSEQKTRKKVVEVVDLQQAIIEHEGWVSIRHISVVELIRRILDKFRDQADAKQAQQPEQECAAEKEDPAAAKKRGRPPGAMVPKRHQNVKVTQISQLLREADKNPCITPTTPMTFRPFTYVLESKDPETRDTYVVLPIPDSEAKWTNDLGLLTAQPTLDYPGLPMLFLLVQKDTLCTRIPSDRLVSLGVDATADDVMTFKLNELMIKGNKEKQEQFMRLYHCDQKGMCTGWNELAAQSVTVIDARVSLKQAVRDEFKRKKGRNINPFFIPVGLGWICNADKVAHDPSVCLCTGGKDNPYSGTIFNVFMKCINRTLVVSMLFPGNLLAFADTDVPCERFRELFDSSDVKDFLRGR